MVVFASAIDNSGVSAVARALKFRKSNVTSRFSQLEQRIGAAMAIAVVILIPIGFVEAGLGQNRPID